jgi:mycoredoxin
VKPGILKGVGAVLAVGLCFAAGLWLGPNVLATVRAGFPEPAYREHDSAQLLAQSGHRIVLFSTATCPFCAQARALLDARGADYADLRVDESAQTHAAFKAIEGSGVPVLLIGRRRIDGFREDAIVEALAALAEKG